MGVSAVPGSGKTATMAALAARLLAERGQSGCPLPENGRILVVTYQNAAVETLRTRIREELVHRDVSPVGFDVRTLHSLSFSIVQTYPGHAGAGADFRVLDDRAAADLLDKSVRLWNESHEPIWHAMAPGSGGAESRYSAQSSGGRWEETWTRLARSIGSAVIGAAKNLRLPPAALQPAGQRDAECTADMGSRFLDIGAAIFALYQAQVETMGGLDFDDMVRMAVDLLESHPDLTRRLAERWPVILEDEAQDSVPLQEALLGLLTAERGNWIRVGDPNQSITSTFTAADPRYLRQFLGRTDVEAVEMTVSGRSSPRIIDLANGLVAWASTRHPVSEVRTRAFRQQSVEPTEPGDPQQNPLASESNVAIRPYGSREEEFADVAHRAAQFAAEHDQCTLAILVPTNRLGYDMAEALRSCGARFDERLQSNRSSRSVAEALGGILAYAGDPLGGKALERALAGAREFLDPPSARPSSEPQAQTERADEEIVARLLRSCFRPETYLYPQPGEDRADAFPPVPEAGHLEMARLMGLAPNLRRWMEAAVLPVDEMVMTVSQDLFSGDDLARAQQVAGFVRGRAEANPQWRLPELAAELEQAAGARGLLADSTAAFVPEPGRISLTTMHRAKGLEWDLVYVVGADGEWFPNTLDDRFQGDYEHLGGDPAAMARAAVLSRSAALSQASGQHAAAAGGAVADPQGPPAVHGAFAAADPGAATREAHIETICERLRLLYVAITRARRYLSVSWCREVPMGTRTRAVPGALAVGALRECYDTGGYGRR